MPKKVEEMLYILCPVRAYLAPAKVMGPIVHPLQVTKSVAVQLLMSGAEVHEYNPHTKQTVKLTLANINNSERFDTVAPAKVAEKPVAVEPVMKAGVPNVPAVEPVEDSTEVEAVDVVASEPVNVSTEEVEVDPIKNFVFEYNEDGTVDESNINWSSYSKNQRKAIRAQINEHNAKVIA